MSLAQRSFCADTTALPARNRSSVLGFSLAFLWPLRGQGWVAKKLSDCIALARHRGCPVSPFPRFPVSPSPFFRGLIYTDRIAYSTMAELPTGKIAVLFERGTPSEEYRYLSVAIVTPPWA